MSSPSSCEFLSDRIFFSWSVLVPPSRDLMIILWPSDPLRGLLRTGRDWGGERCTPTLTHQELLVVQGCHDMNLGLCLHSVFPLLFSLGNLLQFHC